LLHLHAVNAKEEITLRQKINGQRLTSWSSANTVDSAENILCIKRPNKELLLFLTFYETVKIESRKVKEQVALTNDFAGQ